MTTPTVHAAIPAVSDLAAALTAQITDGRAGRASVSSVGSPDAAFTWTTGSPPTVIPYVTTVSCAGGSFNVVIVSPSGTPAGHVAEGGTKPAGVVLTAANVPLLKYAGLASFSTEQAIYSDSLVGAITNVLIVQALGAFNAAVIDAIEAAAEAQPAAADWTAAILDGVAAVIGNGGNPQLLLMNPADYVAAVTGLSGGFITPSANSVPTLFGLSILLSPAMTAGVAVVADPAAVTIAESAAGPYVVVDPFSGLATNAIRVAAELFAAAVVTGAAALAKITVGA